MTAQLGPNGWESDKNQAARLRVDPGQIGFWKQWQHRAYLELNIPVAGPAVCARLTSPIDFVLLASAIDIHQGALRVETFIGAVVPSGVWAEVPIIGVNRMTGTDAPITPYIPRITIQTGGQFTGGTAVDLLLLRAAAQNVVAQNVGKQTDVRGLPPATYYMRLSTLTGGVVNNDPAQGVFSIQWEER